MGMLPNRQTTQAVATGTIAERTVSYDGWPDAP
jgi:hypothetical protein